MVTVEEIREKAGSLYPRAIKAWLAGDAEFFPYRLKVSVERDTNYSVAMRAQHALIEHSKANRKLGYRLEFRKVKSRLHGEQNFVAGVYFDSMLDLVSFTGKKTEFDTLKRSVELIDRRLPALKQWRTDHWRVVLKHAPHCAELIAFAEYMQKHPMPGCHIRELPIAISTKTIDRCNSIMEQWLDLLLPPSCKNHGAASFEERFGFEVTQDHFRLRILDPQLLCEHGLPCEELSLPIAMLRALVIHDCHVIIVENKVNLSKLPTLPRTLALGGLGFGIACLLDLPWLLANQVTYWGDIDVIGFEILAHVRSRLPHVQSLLMDVNTLESHQALVMHSVWQQPTGQPLAELNADELANYQLCRDQSLRLEQERIPREYVRAQLLKDLPKPHHGETFDEHPS